MIHDRPLDDATRRHRVHTMDGVRPMHAAVMEAVKTVGTMRTTLQATVKATVQSLWTVEVRGT